MGDGSLIQSALDSRVRESDSESEQEASLLTVLHELPPLRLRDEERPLPLLLLDDLLDDLLDFLDDLLEDLLLDDPRDDEEDDLRFDEEVFFPTDKSFLPAIDAGDLGGR